MTKQESDIKKSVAIQTLEKWAKDRLKTYQEPTREGTPRGAEVGFSQKKLHAAILCNLHPALKLHEIAAMAEISPGLLRQWRMDDHFMIVVMEEGSNFAMSLVHTVGESINDIDKVYKIADIVPYYEDNVVRWVSILLTELWKNGNPDETKTQSFYILTKTIEVMNDYHKARTKKQKKEAIKKHMETEKAMIKAGIAALPKLNEEEVKCVQEKLIGHIFFLLDALTE